MLGKSCRKLLIQNPKVVEKIRHLAEGILADPANMHWHLAEGILADPASMHWHLDKATLADPASMHWHLGKETLACR